MAKYHEFCEDAVVAIASLSPDPYNVLQFFMAKYVEFYGDAASVGGGNQGVGL